MKKLIFTLFFVLFLFLFSLNSIFWDDYVKNAMLPSDSVLVAEVWEGKEGLVSLFWFARDSIFGLLAFISISVFIFMWARLVMARWNSEELKKVLIQFVYSIVGLTIVALSWAAVQLVSSLNL